MEEFFDINQILERDNRHIGYNFTLEELYGSIASIKLDKEVPETLHSQLNTVKTWLFIHIFCTL